MFEARTYRERVHAGDLVSFTVVVKETDLFIMAGSDLSALALREVVKHRHQLESYIVRHPEFLRSLRPVKITSGAPEVVIRMGKASEAAGVGPMAAVAGTIAELVGEALMKESPEVIVENGGDIFIKTCKPRVVSIYAGDSPLSEKVGLSIRPDDTPLGVCTSSAKVGPSLSLGKAHAACVVSRSTALADAAATAVGNAAKGPGDIEAALAVAGGIPGVLGAVVVVGDRIGAWGQVELVKL